MTNDSVKGYIIMTMKALGYTLEDTSMMLEELDHTFDLFTEEYAEDYYRSLKWQEPNKAKNINRKAN